MIRKTLYAVVFWGALPSIAHAQETAAISSAREVAKSGIEDYFAGRYDAAHDKLSRAFEVVRVPTLALFNARALTKLGKLVEASEFYLTAMRLKSSEGDAETQEQARKDAKLERFELLKRVPRLRVEIIGAKAEEVVVLANGSRVAPSLLATGWMVNPGRVHVTATAAGKQVEATEQFGEAENKTVVLRFAPVVPTVAARPPAETRARPRTVAPTETASPYNTLAWVSVGVSAAGLALGTATGLWAISEKKDLDTGGDCKASRCDGIAAGDQVDRYNRLRHLSSAGLIVSATAAAAAVGLFVYDAKQRDTRGAQVRAWVGLSGVGLGGAF